MTSNAYFTLGSYYFRKGRFLKANSCFLHCKFIRKSNEVFDYEVISACDINLACGYLDLGEYQKSLEVLKEAQTEIILEKGKSTFSGKRILELMSISYLKLEMFNEATKCFKKAERIQIGQIENKNEENEKNFDDQMPSLYKVEFNEELQNTYLASFMDCTKAYEHIKKIAVN